MVTPWPPQWSGVATHSRRIVEELRAHADIDVIAPDPDNGTVYDRSLEPEGVGLFTAGDFDWLAACATTTGCSTRWEGHPSTCMPSRR